jgi:hypothetical protein
MPVILEQTWHELKGVGISLYFLKSNFANIKSVKFNFQNWKIEVKNWEKREFKKTQIQLTLNIVLVCIWLKTRTDFLLKLKYKMSVRADQKSV